MEERGAVTGKAKASGRFLVQVSTMKDIGLQALAKYDLESESKSDDDLVVGGTGYWAAGDARSRVFPFWEVLSACARNSARAVSWKALVNK